MAHDGLQPPGLPPQRREAAAAQPEIHRPIVSYPGFDVLSQARHWDEATRRVILDRVQNVPPIRFFRPEEVRLLEAILDRFLPQDDRPPEQRIPIVPWIDHTLFHGIIDGHRFADLPPQEVGWRRFLEGVDEVARLQSGRPFVELSGDEQDRVLEAIAEGDPPGQVWERLHAERFWVWQFVPQVVSVYYAHPTAWNEIGYGGPAYPRGYVALNHGYPEPWEVREVRHDATPG